MFTFNDYLLLQYCKYIFGRTSFLVHYNKGLITYYVTKFCSGMVDLNSQVFLNEISEQTPNQNKKSYFETRYIINSFINKIKQTVLK